MEHKEKEHLLQDFYNFCMDNYGGQCKEEAIYDYLENYDSPDYPESGRKQAVRKMALDNIQREWDENQETHLQQRFTADGIRSSQISALVSYLVDIGVITDSNVNDTNII